MSSVENVVARSVVSPVARAVEAGVGDLIERVLGNDTIGGTQPQTLNDYAWAHGPFTPETDGALQSISIYTITSGRPITLGVWENDTGDPGTLVAVTSGSTSVASDWLTLPISGDLEAAKSYWLGWVHDIGGLDVRYAVGTATMKFVSSVYSAGDLPNPYPGSASQAVNRDYSIYATYLG